MASSVNTATNRNETQGPDIALAVCAFVCEGNTQADAARKFNLNAMTVSRMCRKAGLVSQPSKEERGKREEEVCNFLEAGHTQTEACRKFGMAPSTVSRIAKRAKLSTRSRITRADVAKRDEEIRQSNKSSRELAELYGCSIRNIQRIRHQ